MSFKEFIYFNKKKVFFVFVCIVVLVVILIFNLYDQDKLNIFNDDVEVDVELDKEEEIEKKEEEQDNLLICFFDIKGEVVKPGVYSIECNKRVIEKTTTNMIQKISPIFTVNPLISKEI